MVDYILNRITPPVESLLTLDEVKQHLRIDTSDSDAEINRLINTAESYLDGAGGIMGRALRPQVWRYDIPVFTDLITLPLPPTISVDSIQYYDADNVLQTLANTQYFTVDGGYSGDIIYRGDNVTYPNTYTRKDAVQITFTAGYQDLNSPTVEPIPENIRNAAVMLIKILYDNPGTEVPEVVRQLIAPYRVNYV